MSTSKKQQPSPAPTDGPPIATHAPPTHVAPPPTHVAPPPTHATAPAQQTDDVVVDEPVKDVSVGKDGTVDPATAGAQPLQTESIKDAFTGAATAMGNNLEGGSKGLPKDPNAFSLAFQVMGQVISFFAGFHTFMTAVKRPQDAVLVPAAAKAVTENWPLLLRLVPAALADINITTITALLARLLFVQTLLKHVGTLNDRMLAVQSHLEDQLVTQMRPLYNRCYPLFVSHDDLSAPMEPVVQLFSISGQKSADARKNNQQVANAAVAAAASNAPPAPPETPTTPGIVVPPGTVVTPGTVVPPGAVAHPGKTPPAPPAAHKGRTRG